MIQTNDATEFPQLDLKDYTSKKVGLGSVLFLLRNNGYVSLGLFRRDFGNTLRTYFKLIQCMI